MNRRPLQDRDFRTIGYVETRDDGTEVLTDANFRTKGYYDPNRNLTTDEQFRTVGYGNMLVSLLAVETAAKHMTQQSQDKRSSAFGGLGFFILAAIVVFAGVLIFCPGLVLIAFFKSWFSPAWGAAQMWTFGVALSVAIWFGFYAFSRSFRKASVHYLILCLTVLAIFAFSHFGLQTRFSENAIAWYFPRGTANTSPAITNVSPSMSRTEQDSAAPRAEVASSATMPVAPTPSAPPTSYRVNGLPLRDSLNVQGGPASTYPIIIKLRQGDGGITLRGGRMRNGATVWQEISVRGNGGWVNADYLAPEVSQPSSQQ